MVLFSATYDEDVMKFAENLIKDPVIMRLKRNEETLDNIQQVYVYEAHVHKHTNCKL